MNPAAPARRRRLRSLILRELFGHLKPKAAWNREPRCSIVVLFDMKDGRAMRVAAVAEAWRNKEAFNFAVTLPTSGAK